ncbi:MAG: four helix bundle protein [Saprospiraceae bacterium]
MSYRNQIIWQLARQNAVEIHKMTLTKLPKFELYEVESQIRRSSKSVCSNIVEGYGRRKYKGDYIKFIIYALSSNDETIDHLEMLLETKSLQEEVLFQNIHSNLVENGKRINRFLQKLEASS